MIKWSNIFFPGSSTQKYINITNDFLNKLKVLIKSYTNKRYLEESTTCSTKWLSVRLTNIVPTVKKVGQQNTVKLFIFVVLLIICRLSKNLKVF